MTFPIFVRRYESERYISLYAKEMVGSADMALEAIRQATGFATMVASK